MNIFKIYYFLYKETNLFRGIDYNFKEGRIYEDFEKFLETSCSITANVIISLLEDGFINSSIYWNSYDPDCVYNIRLYPKNDKYQSHAFAIVKYNNIFTIIQSYVNSYSVQCKSVTGGFLEKVFKEVTTNPFIIWEELTDLIPLDIDPTGYNVQIYRYNSLDFEKYVFRSRMQEMKRNCLNTLRNDLEYTKKYSYILNPSGNIQKIIKSVMELDIISVLDNF